MASSWKLRSYSGFSDLPGMVDVINASRERDGSDDRATLGDLSQQYRHLQRCDPARDIRVAEEDEGRIVGYARTTWDDFIEGDRGYWVVAEAHPDHEGLAEALVDWVESRATEVAAEHPHDRGFLVSWADEASSRAGLLRQRGYVPARFGAVLARSLLTALPERELPEGVEVRPVEESHLPAIWEADVEAFRDHWGFSEQTDADWEKWLDEPHREVSLWQVAWAGDLVVGQVRSFIDAEENALLDRLRGWTEDISTHRQWRRRGLAGALICSSLRILADRGMTEAALGVDTENLTGAHRLYESLGFERQSLEAQYRRPLA